MDINNLLRLAMRDPSVTILEHELLVRYKDALPPQFQSWMRSNTSEDGPRVYINTLVRFLKDTHTELFVKFMEDVDSTGEFTWDELQTIQRNGLALLKIAGYCTLLCKYEQRKLKRDLFKLAEMSLIYTYTTQTKWENRYLNA